jgi:hypothetical protein
MRQIYQQAKSTIVYLGQEADDSSLAVRYMTASWPSMMKPKGLLHS